MTWQNGLAEAVERLREHVPPWQSRSDIPRLDARDRAALAFVLDTLAATTIAHDAAVHALKCTYGTPAEANAVGREGTCTSVPGSAWDVIAQDRDEWKLRAQRAECNSHNLEAEILDVRTRAYNAETARDEWRRESVALNKQLSRLRCLACGETATTADGDALLDALDEAERALAEVLVAGVLPYAGQRERVGAALAAVRKARGGT